MTLLWRALKRIFAYGNCVECNRRNCPKLGPWYAPRRASCYCADCEWKGFFT